MAALDDRPRSGKEPTITAEATAWVADLACRKAKELGCCHDFHPFANQKVRVQAITTHVNPAQMISSKESMN
jgi:hypothetical protein